MKIYNIKKKVVLAEDERGCATYIEVPYTEYRSDGSIYCTGTEDFTRERFNTLVRRTIYKPTGKLDRGGHRMWEDVATITAGSTKDVREFATLRYGKDISIRQY